MAQEILERIATGDRTAVQDCIDQYGGLVWSLARRMISKSDDAEDAVQEIFLDIWKNAERFDPARANEVTFVAMIARRRIIDRIRSDNRRIQTHSIEDMTAELPARSGEDLQISVEAAEAGTAFRSLKVEQRQVLQLSILYGMSHQEIADATGMPLGTVKTHARRGIIQARENLGLGSMNSGKEAPA